MPDEPEESLKEKFSRAHKENTQERMAVFERILHAFHTKNKSVFNEEIDGRIQKARDLAEDMIKIIEDKKGLSDKMRELMIDRIKIATEHKIERWEKIRAGDISILDKILVMMKQREQFLALEDEL
jgi:hypothetical protein